MRKLLIIILSFTLAACSNKTNREGEYELIAHAGGAISGNIYSNSLEALENAVKEGYRYIELDFILTADSQLVAAHSWEKFNEITGYSHLGDTAPTLTEFLSRYIYNKYTPITASAVRDFFLQHDSIFLVVDKISDKNILRENFAQLKDRMIVEAFSYDDYIQLIDEGYYRVMYSCMAEDFTSTLLKHSISHWIMPKRTIEWITLHTSVFDKVSFKLVNTLLDYKVALFTVNDTITEIPKEYNNRVYMIYTDSIKPNK